MSMLTRWSTSAIILTVCAVAASAGFYESTSKVMRKLNRETGLTLAFEVVTNHDGQQYSLSGYLQRITLTTSQFNGVNQQEVNVWFLATEAKAASSTANLITNGRDLQVKFVLYPDGRVDMRKTRVYEVPSGDALITAKNAGLATYLAIKTGVQKAIEDKAIEQK